MDGGLGGLGEGWESGDEGKGQDDAEFHDGSLFEISELEELYGFSSEEVVMFALCGSIGSCEESYGEYKCIEPGWRL